MRAAYFSLPAPVLWKLGFAPLGCPLLAKPLQKERTTLSSSLSAISVSSTTFSNVLTLRITAIASKSLSSTQSLFLAIMGIALWHCRTLTRNSTSQRFRRVKDMREQKWIKMYFKVGRNTWGLSDLLTSYLCSVTSRYESHLSCHPLRKLLGY